MTVPTPHRFADSAEYLGRPIIAERAEELVLSDHSTVSAEFCIRAPTGDASATDALLMADPLVTLYERHNEPDEWLLTFSYLDIEAAYEFSGDPVAVVDDGLEVLFEELGGFDRIDILSCEVPRLGEFVSSLSTLFTNEIDLLSPWS